MKKFLKVIGILLLLLIVAIIVLPIIFSGRIKEEVKVLANENLTAVMEFEDLSLSLISNFPNVSVEIDQLSITGTGDFEGVKLVDAEYVVASVDLMSLFGAQMKINEVGIVNALIDVRVLESGAANYDIAVPSEETASVEEEAATEEGGFALMLENYYLENAHIIYDDATMPMRFETTGFTHRGSGDFTADLFDLDTKTIAESMDLNYDGSHYINRAKFALDAVLSIDMANAKYTFKDNVVTLNQLKLEADGWISMPGDDIDMDVSFKTKENDLVQLLSMVPAEFTKDLEGVVATGRVDLDGFVRGTYNETTMPGFAANLKVDQGSFQYPDLPGKVNNIDINVSVDASKGADNDAMTVDVDRFYLELENNPVDLTLHLRNPFTDPFIDCALQAKVVLDNLKETIPLENGDELSGSITANFNVKGRMSAAEEERYEDIEAEGDLVILGLNYASDSLPYDVNLRSAYFKFNPSHIALTQFMAEIGNTDLSASGRINNYLSYFLKDELLQGTFNVNSNNLDLNEFLAEEEGTEEEETTAADSTGTGGIIELPNNIDFKLNANFAKMVYEDLVITNAKGGIGLKEAVASIDNLSLETLGGTVKVNGSYSTKNTQPEVDMTFAILNMDIQQAANTIETIDKLAPIAKSCKGKFSTNMSLVCMLDDNMEPIENTITGGGKVQTKSVFIDKFEPLNKLASELKMERLAKQTIEDINITYRFQDGKVFVDPFTVKVDGIPATIDGTMSFQQELDYKVKMNLPADRLPGNLGNQASGLLGDLNAKFGSNISIDTNIPISLRIRGTIDKPEITGNYGEALKEQKEELKDQVKEQVKEVVKEQIDNTKAEAVAKAKEEVTKLMEDAQKEAAKLMADARKLAADGKDVAYKEAQKIEDSAKNPFEKAAKRLAAEKLKTEADKAHDKSIEEAQKRADKLIAAAQKQADAKVTAAEEL
ncbi:MAG: hypothetical protein ACJAU0_002426 [Flavobacteriales bacterium]|jgi:hypothetical protein